MTKTTGANHFGLALTLTAVLVTSVAAPPLRADHLVLEDGSTIETKGPWEVRGAIVVFTLPNGSLSSIRTTKVDLDASARATVQAQEEPVARPEVAAPVQPALVLTDRDVAHVSPQQFAEVQPNTEPAATDDLSDPSATEPEADTSEDGFDLDQDDFSLDPEADATEPVADVERLQVTTFDRSQSPSELGGTSIIGTLVNSSQEIATQIQVTVRLVDSSGDLIASTEAAVTSSALRPQQSTTFRADIPGVTSYDQVQFETESIALAWRPAADRQ